MLPGQGRVWGNSSSVFGRAVYRVRYVTCASAVCTAMFFSQNLKKQSAGPNGLGIFEFENASSSPGNFFFFFFPPPFVCYMMVVLCSNIMITKGKSLSHSDSAR